MRVGEFSIDHDPPRRRAGAVVHPVPVLALDRDRALERYAAERAVRYLLGIIIDN